MDSRVSGKFAEAARITNDALLSESTLGIEVTIPELAARCRLGNIDPQHSSTRSSEAAIEAILRAPTPAPGSMLVTVRPDLDSVGAMALLELRARGGLSLSEDLAFDVIRRVKEIAAHDKFANGPWRGAQPLPSEQNPWPETAVQPNAKTLAALSAMVADFKVPLQDRVAAMMDYLVSGTVPADYEQQVARERANLAKALDRGEIAIEKHKVGDLDVCVVETTHRAATLVAYTQAPVAILVNPSMPVQGSTPIRKLTVCQYADGHVDLGALQKLLSSEEPGWGGSRTIIGSPQGRSSGISPSRILDALREGASN